MRGLYGQLMAVTSAVLVVAVGISLWVLFSVAHANAVAQTRSEAAAALVVAARAAVTGINRDEPGDDLFTKPMLREEHHLHGTVGVVAADGSYYIVAEGGHRVSRGASDRTVAAHLPRGGRTTLVGISRDSTVWAAQALPASQLNAAARQIGPLFVVWRVPVRSPPFPTPTQVGVLISGLAAIVLAQILWALVARRLTAPLAALLTQMDRYAQGDFRPAPAIRAPSEFMRLAEAMGRMGDALAAERDARESFIAEVAHDLRTPLTAMRGLLGSLRVAAATDPATVQGRLAVAEREAQRLTRLVNDLLDLARYETGHLSIQSSDVDLREVAVLGAVSGEAAAEARGVAFEVDLPDAAVPVWADLDRGAQILVNLVDNAVRYTPPGGRVRVSVHREDSAGTIRVEDNGPGFEAGATEWVWSAFTRGRAARENDGGTGLGLAVGRALARVMGGDLRILPAAPGLGGRVELRLPLRAAVLPDDERARPARPGAPETSVDDRPSGAGADVPAPGG